MDTRCVQCGGHLGDIYSPVFLETVFCGGPCTTAWWLLHNLSTVPQADSSNEERAIDPGVPDSPKMVKIRPRWYIRKRPQAKVKANVSEKIVPGKKPSRVVTWDSAVLLTFKYTSDKFSGKINGKETSRFGIAYRRVSECAGAPVLLLNGGEGLPELWAGIAGHLVATCDVVSADVLGCGGSSMPIDYKYSDGSKGYAAAWRWENDLDWFEPFVNTVFGEGCGFFVVADTCGWRVLLHYVGRWPERLLGHILI